MLAHLRIAIAKPYRHRDEIAKIEACPVSLQLLIGFENNGDLGASLGRDSILSGCGSRRHLGG